MDHVLVCPCGEVVLKSVGDVAKLRSKILLFKGLETYAVCKRCNREFSVPIRLDPSMTQENKQPKLFVNKK